MIAAFQPEPFDLANSSPKQYAALNRHSNLLRQERLPDDPPIPLEERINELTHIPPFVVAKMWCAWDEAHHEIVAEGILQMLNMKENQHLGQFDITVHPDFRRQGLARQLLAFISEAALAGKRRLLITATYDRIPAGEAFMTRLGGQRGLEGHVNQLRMADLDQSMLQHWLEQGKTHLADFELGLWDGPYPEGQLSEVSQLYELTNQQPFGDVEIEDMHMTPERLRQTEQMLFARGNQRWTFYVIERKTGKFAGYSETMWNPNRPEILQQDMTGVFPEYRKQGLGRWLKAAMLEKVLKDRPQVKFVRTGNADVNAAMLKINNELGFKPYMANVLWQVEMDKVLAYLGKS